MDLELAEIFQKSAASNFTSASNDFAFPTVTVVDKKEEEQVVEEQKKQMYKETPERLSRTLFIGNVPITVLQEKRIEKAFKKIFTEYGTIESVRFRSIALSKPIDRRVGVRSGQFHEQRDSCNAYIVMSSLDDATRIAQHVNGFIFEEHHLRIDFIAHDAISKLPTKKSVFVGNLSLTVKDESLWKLFGQCGVIDFVRLVRDKMTSLGKGFGYVAFKEKAAVELAIKLAGSDCEGRPIRVTKCAKIGYKQAGKKAMENKRGAKSTPNAADGGKNKFDNFLQGRQQYIEQKNQKGRDKKLKKTKELENKWKMPDLVAKGTEIKHITELRRNEKTGEMEPKRKAHPAEIRLKRKREANTF